MEKKQTKSYKLLKFKYGEVLNDEVAYLIGNLVNQGSENLKTEVEELYKKAYDQYGFEFESYSFDQVDELILAKVSNLIKNKKIANVQTYDKLSIVMSLKNKNIDESILEEVIISEIKDSKKTTESESNFNFVDVDEDTNSNTIQGSSKEKTKLLSNVLLAHLTLAFLIALLSIIDTVLLQSHFTNTNSDRFKLVKDFTLFALIASIIVLPFISAYALTFIKIVKMPLFIILALIGSVLLIFLQIFAVIPHCIVLILSILAYFTRPTIDKD